MSTDTFAMSKDSSIRMPDTFLSSFVTDGMPNSTIKSGMSASGYNDSLAYSNTYNTLHKEASRAIPMEVIQSEEGDSSSRADQDEALNFNRIDEEDEEDIERFEEIDINSVDVTSPPKTNKSRKQKALLSPDEIAQAHRMRDQDVSVSNRTDAEYNIRCKDFIESGKYILDDFKKAMGKLVQL